MPANEDNEAEDFFENLKTDEEQANKLLAEYFAASDNLFLCEEKLAENLAHQLKPFEPVYKRFQKHTAFRASMFSLFLNPNDNCELELFKYERDYEDF